MPVLGGKECDAHTLTTCVQGEMPHTQVNALRHSGVYSLHDIAIITTL